MDVEADTRDAAVAKLQGMTTEASLAEHWSQMHPGEPAMSLADAHAGIARDLMPK